jgi:hypothetical protein
MDPLVSSHGVRGIDIGVVGGPRLSALGEGEHKDRSEMPRQEPQDARTYIAAPGSSDVVTEQGQPVLLVAGLRGSQCQQDLALLTGASTGQVPVHGGFGSLVRQVLTPTPKIGGRRCRPPRPAGSSQVHHPMMRQHTDDSLKVTGIDGYAWSDGPRGSLRRSSPSRHRHLRGRLRSHEELLPRRTLDVRGDRIGLEHAGE